MIALLIVLLLQAPAVPKSSIAGIVIDGGAPYTQPLIDARVQLEGSPIILRTDMDGHFSFPGLSAGRYRLNVTRDGFIRQSLTVTVTAGQDKSDVRVAMQFAPTIVGRIQDINNVPLEGLLVEAMKVTYGPRGDRSVVAAVSTLTDDRGEFHLYWLDPGDYYIRASSLPTKSESNSAQSTTVYAPAYYPGFRDPRDATKFHLRIGTQLKAFDFRMQPSISAGLRGLVTSEATGAPLAAIVTLTPEGNVASSQKYIGKSIVSVPPTRDDGYYFIGAVPSGTYVLTATAISGGQILSIAKKVTLRAINSMNLLLSPGVSVAGQVVSEDQGFPVTRTVKALVEAVDPDLPSPSPASLDAKGQFSADRVGAGDYSIRLLGLTGDVYMKSATSGGVDILAKPLHLDLYAPAPIRITLGSDGGHLDGAVYDKADHAYEGGASVVLVPDASRRNLPSQFFVVESGDSGRYSISGIPPGDYKLFAWQSLEPNAYLDPSFLAGYEVFGVAVSIASKSNIQVSVRVIELD